MKAPVNRIKLLHEVINENLRNINPEQLGWNYAEYRNGFEFNSGVIVVSVNTRGNLIRLECAGYRNAIEDNLELFLKDKKLEL